LKTLRRTGMKIFRAFFSRTLVTLLVAVTLAVAAASPALAYGKENWQIGFAGTATAPTSGFGFGFWGWCAFGGGVTSGNDGDCQFSQYFHTSGGGGFTCQESLDITLWTGTGGTFVITGTATVHPASLTAPCLALFGGAPSFTGLDTGLPAAAGHYNLSPLVLGLPGELQIQVTQIP
jgi:hypothetical protein